MPRYYGWYMVAVSMLVLMLVTGSTVSAFGLFVLPVSQDFGLSRAEMNTGIILVNLGMAFFAPPIGRLLDRVSIRKLMAASGILIGMCFAALALSRNVWLSAFVVAVPLPIAVVGAGTLTSTALVARWFEVHRGRAMALAAIGFSLASILMVPALGMLIGTFGWRNALLVLAGVLPAVILLMAFVARDRPGPDDVEVPSGEGLRAQGQVEARPAEKPLQVMQLLRMPSFCLIALGSALGFAVLQTITVSLVPYAQQSGLSIVEASSLFSVFGATAIGAKLMLAWLADRLSPLVLLAGLFGLVGACSAAILVSTTYPSLVVCSALLGVVAGATTPAFTTLLANRFGAASFGTTFGTASLVSALASAACVRFGGEVFDRTGSYQMMFVTFIGFALIAGVLVFTAGMMGRQPKPEMA